MDSNNNTKKIWKFKKALICWFCSRTLLNFLILKASKGKNKYLFGLSFNNEIFYTFFIQF